jgi:hypothetical protein
MTLKSSTLFVASAVLSLAFASSATAFTHHPATPEEKRQTDALNAQALANARGTAGGQEAATPMPANQQTAAMTPASATATATVAPLKSLASMPPALSSASVQSSAGATVGNVQKVLTGADGKPSMVNVALSNQKIVGISAEELNYDATRNILVATLTTEQIMSLPAAGS